MESIAVWALAKVARHLAQPHKSASHQNSGSISIAVEFTPILGQKRAEFAASAR
jgi:hypothetical protein